MRKIYSVHAFNNGDQIWYHEDKLHRENGPAHECVDGSRFWYLNGVYHCLYGPAVMYADGTQYYYINGTEYTRDAYNKIVSDIVDYHTAITSMNWPADESSSIDVISALNDVAVNSMNKVYEFIRCKTILLGTMEKMQHNIPEPNKRKSIRETMLESKELVARSRALRAELRAEMA